MLFYREDAPSNFLEAEAKPFEDSYIELNLPNLVPRLFSQSPQK